MQKIWILPVMVLGAIFSGCNSNPKPNPDPSPLATCPATITIGPGNVYSPASCKIAVGATVTISASNSHPLNGSGAGRTPINQATTDQTIAFPTAGTFEFQCQFHSSGGMKGSIIVQ